MLGAHRRLREQIRRPKTKGVIVRRVQAADLEPGTGMRRQAEALAREWLGSRRMVPMSFLVALEPFHLPDEHRYFVAERRGRMVAFLSAVPCTRVGGGSSKTSFAAGTPPTGRPKRSSTP